ncbi:MAG: phosphoglucomutase/phosphomannomutase family protein [Chloroherpetonaceae bacterium]|nr:phosphoglucomutase/phosphomannomutase family protein [Chloroherpetonaceae bacterium]MDW8438433.1 phosphoglucomutase/phosphomannomutase family protein [Chloroherpetonaceae bacterium]
MSIKFGTDGWRAVIAKDYTFENLKQVALATGKHFLAHPNIENGVCVGYDTRFMSRQFAEYVAEIFSSLGIKVFLSNSFLPTPAVSLFVKKRRLAGGAMITASHNPPFYNGFKVKADYGGSAHPEQIAEIEKLLPTVDKTQSVQKNSALIELADLKSFYLDALKAELDLDAIRNANLKIGHNAMFGAGQGVVKTLLGDCVREYHCAVNPTFDGINPEPIPNYLQDYFPVFKAEKLDVAILNDGDADRVAMLNEKGEYVDSHKIFAVILKYLVEEKKMTGDVARTYALTQVIDKLCQKHNLPCHNLPIGFKHVGKLMTTNNVLMGGEESGGIGVTAHLPERDGVYVGLLVLEIIAKRRKTLSELVEELYDEFGFFAYDRIDAHLTEDEKRRAIERASRGDFKDVAGYKVIRFENLDGYKYFFEGGWLLIRPSGTEPVLRLYCEADSEAKVKAALAFARSLAKD